MPKDSLALLAIKANQLEVAALLKWPREVPQLPINFGDDCAFNKRLGNAFGDHKRRRLPRGTLFFLSI